MIVFINAPGEGCRPSYILLDEKFDCLGFPDLFPWGEGGLHPDIERKVKISRKRLADYYLHNVNPMFSQSLDYIFAVQYAAELCQIVTDMNLAMKRFPKSGLTAGRLQDKDYTKKLVQKDYAYRFMTQIRGTPAFWLRKLYEALAMLRTFGTPTYFLTLSCAEFLWPEIIMAIGACTGVTFTEEDVEKMSCKEKATYLRNNPVVCVEMFSRRIQSFFQDYLLSDAHPLGKIKEFLVKIEF